MLREKKIWTASDGKEFTDYQEALKHDLELEKIPQKNSLFLLIEKLFPQFSPEIHNTIFVTLFQNKSQILSELLTFGLPKRDIPKVTMPSQKPTRKCHRCGVEFPLNGTFGYVCSHQNCPNTPNISYSATVKIL
jgi:hypothetical protein